MEIKERIKEVMNYKGISASEFAREIGVLRSAISHVISGRNKPGLEFILKILNRFPEIDTHWLLTGNGEMLQKNLHNEKEGAGVVRSEDVPEYNAKSPPGKSFHSNENKEIRRIMVFFGDGNYQEFIPRNSQ